MVTTKQAIGAVARHIGLDPPRVAAVARRLTEAGMLPSGAPKTPPILDTEHVVSIVIGAALDVPLRAVAATVEQYRAMTPGGVALAGAPASIRTAGDALDIWADIAMNGDSNLLRRDTIEIVAWPEIIISDAVACSDTRFVPVGADASHWQRRGHRRSTVINGAALVDALRELFARN